MTNNYFYSNNNNIKKHRVLYKLLEHRTVLFSMTFILILALVAIIGPMISPYTYYDQDLNATNASPTYQHWLGTDNLGRDLFIRIIFGARISLAIGFVASLINLSLGIVYGGIAGYKGGIIDNVMMRIVDILWGVPLLLYVIIFMVVFEPGLKNIFLALGFVYWLNMARIVRSQVLQLKEQDYITAARLIGASDWQIITKHILPNAWGVIIVNLTFSIPSAIFTEAFLSFIGLGVSAPMASWGVLAAEGMSSLRSYPYQLFFPAIAICFTMLAFNFLGDGLRDMFDPKSQKS